MAKKQVDTHCARCIEVLIVPVVSKWTWNSSTLVRNPSVMQRLLFDSEHPPEETCRTCRRMQKFLSCRKVYFMPTKVTFTSRASLHDSIVENKPHEVDPIQLRIWDCPSANVQGQTVIYGVCSPSTFPLPRVQQPMWRVHHVREVLPQPDWELIKSWLRGCSDGHGRCRPGQYPELQGMRVVDVERRRLVSLPHQAGYLALSYVWGQVEQFVMHNTGPLPDYLSLTVEDAITAVQQLGYKYLWVDSICIDQQNAQDKHSQIALMHQIYHGAIATLIVLDSCDANSGIPGIRSTRTCSQTWAEFGENRMLSRLPPLSIEVEQSSWASRAWTYQEGLLSHRRILFTKNQVHFICNELASSEDIVYAEQISHQWAMYQPILNPLDFMNFTQQHHDSFQIYKQLINGYISRHMTNQEDALHAITGLLQGMEDTVGESFHFALPLSNFRQALLWTQDCASHYVQAIDTTNDAIATRRPVDTLPSWSWVGWKLQNPIRIESLKVDKSLLPPLQVYYLDPKNDFSYTPIDVDSWSARIEPDQNPKSHTQFHGGLHRLWSNLATYSSTSQNNRLTAIENCATSSSVLFIKGLIFMLPCKKMPIPGLDGVYHQFDFGLDELRFADHVANFKEIEVDTRLEDVLNTYIPLKPPSTVEQGLILPPEEYRLAIEDSVVEHDFLWVSTRILRHNSDGGWSNLDFASVPVNMIPQQFRNMKIAGEAFTEISLILLFWKNNIGQRGGVIKLKARWSVLEKLIMKFQPRHERFWLG